jgi:hypothetical protein
MIFLIKPSYDGPNFPSSYSSVKFVKREYNRILLSDEMTTDSLMMLNQIFWSHNYKREYHSMKIL